MGKYRNFKMVIYCTAQSMVRITEAELAEQLAFFQKYTGCDKVYLEPYRDGLMIPDDQLKMVKTFFLERGIEVSGALTTTCEDLCEADSEKQRLGGTYCYTNQAMRERLVKTVRYTARHFDEFIIDDWFFTGCTCEDCRKAKGNRSWEEFRTSLLAEVSRELIMKPAKEENPNCRVIIKFPNWSEAYQESGYQPAVQRHIFDAIYTGTETRDTHRSDQHLPKYCSYSLMRLMENYAPGRNGGGWFDPYGCYPMELYGEQAYLTAFARGREICQFCWGSLYRNRVVTPIGLQLEEIDRMLDQAGACTGVSCYLPPDAQGEDHLEDFLGMIGIPMDPTPDFPYDRKTIFLTAQALKDPLIISRLTEYVANGGKAIVTSGFYISALGKGIEELSSIRYRGRRFQTDTFIEDGMFAPNTLRSRHPLTFPLLEHRNNTTWALSKGVVGEENYPLILRDCYGKGQLITLAIPDEYGYLYSLPKEILGVIRSQFLGDIPYRLDGPSQVSLFSYDNDVFAVYRYVSNLSRGRVRVVLRGVADSITDLRSSMQLQPSVQIVRGEPYTSFDIPMLEQGDFRFFRIAWNANREGMKAKRIITSAPHTFD